MEHHAVLKMYLEKGTSCGGLRASIFADFVFTTAEVEMQVLGLIGKLLTGPLMKAFYTSATNQIDHVDGILVVKDVILKLKEQNEIPLGMLTRPDDFFGNLLNEGVGTTLKKLREPPKNEEQLRYMMKACLEGIIEVLERQYKKYFECGITEQ